MGLICFRQIQDHSKWSDKIFLCQETVILLMPLGTVDHESISVQIGCDPPEQFDLLNLHPISPPSQL